MAEIFIFKFWQFLRIKKNISNDLQFKIKAEVRLTYLKRPYIITMGTFQMAILLCLNATTTITVKDLLESTQLPEKDLIKQVQSLIDAKIITLIDPKGENTKVIS